MDEQENVDAGSETADTTASEQSTETTDTSASETAQADETAEAEPAETSAVDPDASRTGFVEKGNPGNSCTCPDGRKGTIHKFDNGLICIPNADQS